MENTGLNIIIADDSVQNRENKKEVMKTLGMNVILSTGDGTKVLDAIRNKKVDVVIMDIILPGIDGIGILEETKDIPQKPIFIIETALHMDNLVNEAIQHGADYYILKPASTQMLIRRIYQLLDRRDKSKLYSKNIDFDLETTDIIKTKDVMKKNTETFSNNISKEEIKYSGNLELDITNILHKIGIPAHIKGYKYIREGVLLSFKDWRLLDYITKSLYPTIAEKYNTTSSSVERTIRHAIEVAWTKGNLETLENMFGNTICAGRGKPTNSEFMSLVTDMIRLAYKKYGISYD